VNWTSLTNFVAHRANQSTMRLRRILADDLSCGHTLTFFVTLQTNERKVMTNSMTGQKHGQSVTRRGALAADTISLSL